VIGLGPNLFYNSPMEACVVVCRVSKPLERRGKILLINAVNEVTRERAQSFLTDAHLNRIVAAYQAFVDVPALARAASLEEVRQQEWNLSIPLYVTPTDIPDGDAHSVAANGNDPLAAALANWMTSSRAVRRQLEGLLNAAKE